MPQKKIWTISLKNCILGDEWGWKQKTLGKCSAINRNPPKSGTSGHGQTQIMWHCKNSKKGTWCHKLASKEQQWHEVLHGIPDELAQLKPVAPFGKRLPGQALGAWTHASLVWRTNWAGCADKCENYRRMPGTKSKGSVHFLNHPEHWNWKQCCHGLFAKTRAGHWSGPNRPWPEEHWSRENRPVRSLQQNCTVGNINSKKMTNSSLHNNNWTIHGTFK